MSGELGTIIELQSTLRELNTAQRRYDGVPEWMAALHEEHSSRKSDIDALRAGAEDAERDRRTAEAAVEDSQTKLNHYQQQIGQVSTQREYKALLKEIDTVKEQISGYEEQAFSALERYEEAAKQVADMQTDFGTLDERYHVELKKWEREKPAVKDQIQQLEERVETLKERVDRRVLAQFERLFQRYEEEALAPIAKVQRSGPNMWHCGVCNYRARPQAVVDIRNNGNLHQCESCQRFLFWEE